MTYHRLYTLGYAGWTAQQVEDQLLDLGGVLVDIRLSPRSRKPGFSGSALRQRFGPRYTHIPALGNENYNRSGAPILLRSEEEGMDRLAPMLQCWPVIVMCGCRDLATCHRLTVADLARERLGVEIWHLTPPNKTE